MLGIVQNTQMIFPPEGYNLPLLGNRNVRGKAKPKGLTMISNCRMQRRIRYKQNLGISF